MHESILVSVDDSLQAEIVLPLVIDLAKRYKSNLVLLRVVPTFNEVCRETTPGTVDITRSGAVLGIEIAKEAARNRIRTRRRIPLLYRGDFTMLACQVCT